MTQCFLLISSRKNEVCSGQMQARAHMRPSQGPKKRPHDLISNQSWYLYSGHIAYK